MEPVLYENDLLIIKNCKQEEIKTGDIISFRRGDSIITHRVEKITNEAGKIYYITKGDNNYALDEQKTIYRDIEGKYSFKINNIGKIVTILKNEKIIIAVIILLFIVNYINYKKNKQKIDRQQQRRNYERNKNIKNSSF